METECPRMTVDTLKDCNKKLLAQMAKDQGIVGWHAMRKDQLIRALSLPRPTKAAVGKPRVPTAERSLESLEATVAARRAPVAAPAKSLTVTPPRALDHAF